MAAVVAEVARFSALRPAHGRKEHALGAGLAHLVAALVAAPVARDPTFGVGISAAQCPDQVPEAFDALLCEPDDGFFPVRRRRPVSGAVPLEPRASHSRFRHTSFRGDVSERVTVRQS